MASSDNRYVPLLQAAAQKYGLPPNLLIAQAQAESNFNPNAVSPTNAQGLMQIEPSNFKAYGVTDPFNPAQNIDAGAHLMADDMRQAHGDTALALRYYHSGTNPQNWGPQTAAYVSNVQKNMRPAFKPMTVQDLDAMAGVTPGQTQTQPSSGFKPMTLQDLDAMAQQPAQPGTPQIETAQQLEPSGAGRFMVGVGRGMMDVGQTVKSALLHGASDIGFIPPNVPQNYDQQVAQEKKLYQSTQPTTGMDVGQVVGQTAATLPAMVATDGAIGAAAPRIASVLGDGVAGNAVRGIGNLLTGNAGVGMTGARGLLARGASAAAQGALLGGEVNALTGQPVTQGAEMGAVMGPAARVLGAGAKAGGRFISNLVSPITTDLSPRLTETTAVNRLVQAAQDDGVTPDQIISKMRELGPQSTPVDAVSALTTKGGANVRQLAEEAAATPGAAQSKAAAVLEGRADSAPGRINQAVKAATGAQGDVHGEAADLMAQRSAHAAPMYQKALSGELQPDARLQAFLNDPVFQSGLARGQEIARLDALAKNVPFNAADFASLKSTPAEEIPSPIVDASGKPLATTTVPGQAPIVSMRAADAAKRGLDDMVEQYRDPTTGRLVLDQRGKALNDVRSSFVNYLDQANPDYAAARAAWSGPSQSLDALNMGRRALSNDPEVTTGIVGKLSPNDRQFFLSGVTRALQDKIASAQDGADVTRKIFGNSLIRNKVAAAFDDPEAFANFEKQMQSEAQYAATRNEVLKGSQTARRMIGANQADFATPVNHLIRGDIGSATRSGLGAISQWAMTPSAKQMEAQGNLLFEQNPDVLAKAFARAKPGAVQRTIGNALTNGAKAVLPASMLGYEFNQTGR